MGGKSAIFRYLLKTFTLRKLLFITVRSEDYNCCGVRTIAGKYFLARDLRRKTPPPSRYKRLVKALFASIFSAGLTCKIALDKVGIAEEEHISIVAPKGVRFTPVGRFNTGKKYRKSTRGKMSRRDRRLGRRLGIRDNQRNSVQPSDNPFEDKDKKAVPHFDRETDFQAAMTPGKLSVRTKKLWDDSSNGPHRRLPVNGSSDHDYRLDFGLAPRLGLRSIGYFAFAVLSWLLLYISRNVPSVDGPFLLSTGSILSLASIIVVITVGHEDDSYMRHLLFRIPRIFCYLCIIADAVALLASLPVSAFPFSEFIVDCKNALGIQRITVMGICETVCFVSSIAITAWCTTCLFRQWSWTRQSDAYRLFKVNNINIDNQ